MQGNRQVTFNPPAPAAVTPSPPPPASPAGPALPSFLTPGLDFSVIIPGISSSAGFGTAQQNSLCTAITTGWAQASSGRYSSCTVGSVTTFNGTSVLVSGVAYFTWSSVPTITDSQAASALRDATILALTNSANTILSSAFAGAYTNCACNGVSVVTKTSTASYSYATTIAGVPGPMQCDARLSYDSTNANNIISQVGIDDGSVIPANVGKFCSTPAVTNGVVGVPGSGSCRQYGVQAPDLTTTTATAFTSATNGGAAQITGGQCGVGVTTNCFTAGKGYTSTPKVTASAPNPDGVKVTFPWRGGGTASPTPAKLAAVVVNAANGPYATLPIGSITGTCVDAGKGAQYNPPYPDHVCTGAITTIIDANNVVRSGYTCTNADLNSNKCQGFNGGNTCITYTNNAVTAVRFPGYTKGYSAAPSATGYGVYCTAPPVITFNDAASLQTATYAQFSAVVSTSGATTGQVTSVTMVSPGSGYSSSPILTIDAPIASTGAKFCGPNPITSLSTTIANPVSTNIVAGGTCTPLGRDTVNNVVCSVPAAPGGSGVYAPINVGTCNVVSSFIAQPGSTITNTCGALPQVFNVTATNPSPAPGPSPAPAPSPSSSPTPAPSPAPTPSPSPSPTPSPSPSPKKCTYSGTYYIESVACSGKYIAYNNDPNNGGCTNATVMLRTSGQSSSARRSWSLSAEATAQGTPKSSSLIAIGRDGKCKDDALTNLAATAPPSPRLAGSAWKNKIIPVDAAKDCNTVYIQADTGNSNDGKNLVYGKCSSQTAFSWAEPSKSNAAQWKLTKV